MFAQYSPLFQSGLLSDSPASSRSSTPAPRSTPSLPLTVDTATVTPYTDDLDSPLEPTYFFTLESAHQDDDHSFLSLDLADTRRSVSFGHNITYRASQPRSFASSTSSRRVFEHAHKLSTASAPTIISHRGSSSLRKSSRESLLPAPKPAPSSTLPEIPKRRARPSDLTLTLSACFAESGPVASSSSLHRATHSAPSILSPPANEDISYLIISPIVSLPPTPPPTMRTRVSGASALKATPSFRSTASSNTRQRNRSAALASLEGRNGTRRRTLSRPRNFMSMSDDEDEDDGQLMSVLEEEEDVVIPTKTKRAIPRRSTERRSSREQRRSRRRSTSLFSPLANFLDFCDDDASSRGWRSFIEVY